MESSLIDCCEEWLAVGRRRLVPSLPCTWSQPGPASAIHQIYTSRFAKRSPRVECVIDEYV